MNVYTSFMLFIMAVTVQVWLSDASQTQFPDSKAQADEGRQIFGPVMNLNLSQQGPTLLYANRKDIRIVRTNNKSQNETIIVDGLDNAIAVDFLYAEGFVFWTDVSLEKIKRISVATGKIEDVISVGLKKPEGLAVDWVARKLYWTDCRDSEGEANRIEVANLDGSNRKVLFWKNLGLPRAIAVDPLFGYMFWTDWGEEPKIERAEMDSLNRRVIIGQDIRWPNGLTIDYATQKIYWTDANLLYIAKANYGGSNRERIFKSPSQCVLGHPFALTLYDNKIYWTDWKKKEIHSTNKNTGQRCQRVWSDNYSPMDIHAYEPERQKPRSGKNPCSSTTNGGCSHLCLLNTRGHSCACPTGVKLLPDGKTCEQGPVHFLLLARKVDVRRISLDTPDLTDIVMPISGIQHAVAIDFDPVDNFVYWSDDKKCEIKRARMDGTDVQVIVAIDVRHPDGVAVDWVARNLYWTDTGTDRIEVSRLNGSSRKVLIDNDLDEPRAITLDPTYGYMYWTDWGNHPKIERAALDGSQRVTLVDTSVAWPNGIAIDYHKKKIYWADARLDKIEVMNLDGSNRRIVLDDKLPHVFGFTVLGDRLFWTDWQRKTIDSFNKETGRDRFTIMEGLPDLMGLKAVDRNLTYGKNACSSTTNGGCSHLCLLNTRGHSCACPTGVKLLPDGKTCQQGPVHFLLLARKVDVRRISLDTPDLTDVVMPVSGIQHAVAIDFDPVDKFVYWSDKEKLKIQRSRMDGTDVQVIVAVDVKHPGGVAVDWVARNLYWTDTGTDRIEVSRLNGSSRKVLISEELDEPRAITLDPTNGYMYWTDCGKHPKIERAGLDGSQRVTLVDTSVAWPNGITIDYHKKKIYWADAKLDKIEVMNLDGSNRRLVLDDKLPHVFGFTVLGDRLFWTDWQRKTIETFNKETDRDRLTIMEGVPDLMGLKAVDLNLTYGSNRCQRKNGGCSHLCLYTPAGVRCQCPEGMKLRKRRRGGKRRKKCINLHKHPRRSKN